MTMKMTARKAVSPIIATLLLIAIAVAAGIIVYVYVNSLAGGLTQGGGQQVSDQVEMDAYNFQSLSSLTLTVRDVGSTTVTIPSVFFDGQLTTNSCSTMTPSSTCTLTITPIPSPATSGTSHVIKLLTASGGTAVITVVAGRSG
jgi:archaeal type IV pilus assembly protein PilA